MKPWQENRRALETYDFRINLNVFGWLERKSKCSRGLLARKYETAVTSGVYNVIMEDMEDLGEISHNISRLNTFHGSTLVAAVTQQLFWLIFSTREAAVFNTFFAGNIDRSRSSRVVPRLRRLRDEKRAMDENASA